MCDLVLLSMLNQLLRAQLTIGIVRMAMQIKFRRIRIQIHLVEIEIEVRIQHR